MNEGHFYYIEDQYFIDFPDKKLMGNKDSQSGMLHDRPCFYAFEDTSTGLFWMIPISSQINKFQQIYNSKLNKYGKCETIAFGEVLGYRKAFLIQNMCPITKQYIKNEYCDSKTFSPVRIDARLENEIISKAKRVLALQRKGVDLIFPDVLKIEKQLSRK